MSPQAPRIAKYVAILFIFGIFFFHQAVFASEHSINKFGIHLAQPQDEDIDRAAELVNSTGGEWGYITLVIQEDDKSLDKWQSIFDKLRERSLVPIIRLATSPEGENWKRPDVEDVDEWVDFLNSLHWVVKKRYIILFNEPNHATEWGGEVDSKSFAQVNEVFARKLKEANGDYFIMMGGMDASSPQSKPIHMDEGTFVREVVSEIGVEDFNELFDGLSSHSYPNPNFAGRPSSSGRGTVKTYEWELSLLSSLGIKALPVFITETGWNGDVLSRTQIAENFRYAFQNIWIPDDRVIAVTPFVLNYQGEPFLKFSWVKEGNEGEYPEFEVVKEMEKRRGDPEIIQEGSFDVLNLPHEIVEKSTYHLRIPIRNDGQAIWSREKGYDFMLENVEPTQYLISSFGEIKPFETKTIDVYFSTLDALGKFNTRLVLYHGENHIMDSNFWEYEVVSLPSLIFKVSLFPKRSSDGSDFELQIFNEHEELVFRKSGLQVTDGHGTIEKVDNIVLGKKYRVVLLKKHYLPIQTHAEFHKDTNEISFEKMMPLDFDGDGALGGGDVATLFKNLKLLGLWWVW
ncbi:MAG: hypothetical protein Q8P72_05670 [Candidatus Roizmanbacteria bacterium]|nr:hypothetical protein [Candidatus Roizmanbacteria bacterium]